jgi:hypothetical protein
VGVVLNPGVLRGGIQRNMVVAAESEGERGRARADVGLSEKRETEREEERDKESTSEVRVSLYSSVEVMPYARSGVLTAADAASLAGAPALLLLYFCFPAVLLLFYCCITAAFWRVRGVLTAADYNHQSGKVYLFTSNLSIQSRRGNSNRLNRGIQISPLDHLVFLLLI